MVYVNTSMQTHPVSPLLDGDPRDVHMFSGDRYTKTDKSIVLFCFVFWKNRNCKSLGHQEKDKLQILKEIVYKHENDLELH